MIRVFVPDDHNGMRSAFAAVAMASLSACAVKIIALVAGFLLCSTATGQNRTTATSWRVSLRPLLSIGGVDGPEEVLFSHISSCTLDEDGRFYVADNGQGYVSVFDAGGEFIRRIGARGEGPGEFRDVSSIALRGTDTLLVLSALSRRVVAFDRSGKLLETRTIRQTGYFRNTVLFLGDRLLATQSTHPGMASDAGSVLSDTLSLSLLDQAGNEVARIGSVPDAQRVVIRHEGAIHFLELPFSAFASIHGNGSRAVFGHGTQREVTMVDGNGRRVRIDTGIGSKRLPRDWVSRFAAHMHANAENPRLVTRYLETVTMPRDLPYFDELRLDSGGNIWVRPYSPRWDAQNDWRVLSGNGAHLADVALPNNFNPLEIGRDYLVGIMRDVSGAIFVQKYGLERK